jgi:hypothetical protein
MAIIQKHNNIALRKGETPAIIAAMRNSTPKGAATAPTSPSGQARCARNYNQNEFSRKGAKFLFESAVTH